jgi:cadmium resistance protein CadD (predicted permease)
VAFAATNLDDLFLLVAWFAAGRYRTRAIVAGQYAGIGALFAASVAASLLALALPESGLRWLGLVPIGLGVTGLVRGRNDARATDFEGGFVAVAAVTIANGADNIAVYVPLFATRDAQAIAIMAAVFAAMIALWCLAARWLVRHPAAGAPLRRWGPGAVPYALIGIGLWIVLF